MGRLDPVVFRHEAAQGRPGRQRERAHEASRGPDAAPIHRIAPNPAAGSANGQKSDGKETGDSTSTTVMRLRNTRQGP